MLAVKQLESSMRNLSHWLATMEQELNTPIVYHDCDMQEIHTKLQHTQVQPSPSQCYGEIELFTQT